MYYSQNVGTQPNGHLWQIPAKLVFPNLLTQRLQNTCSEASHGIMGLDETEFLGFKFIGTHISANSVDYNDGIHLDSATVTEPECRHIETFGPTFVFNLHQTQEVAEIERKC
jgi:hypothetical protein